MRGAPEALQVVPHGGGIIPAYAGSTSSRSTVLRGFQDHPRVCGEHERRLERRQATSGSSPRMRGARYVFDDGTERNGIIPAYAGSTW